MNTEEKKKIIEGILFAMGDAVSPAQIAAALETDKEEAAALMEEMRLAWDEEERPVRLAKLEDSYQMCTDAAVYPYLIRIARQPRKHVLTDVLLETLSIIAYKQPVTKSEIEKIRGVSCDHAVSKLVEYELVEELGRLDAPGRPMLFGTTEQFLRSFHVSSVEELPPVNPVQMEEFRIEAESEAGQLVVGV